MKFDWKKEEKKIYLPNKKPCSIDIPKFKYFTIEGKGNPNSEEFAKRVGALYSIVYAVKMMPKSGYTPSGYFEYSVYPLEGVWDLSEEGRKQNILNKDEFVYKIMIRQPDFVDKSIFIRAIETTKKKKPNTLLDEVKFEEIQDGLSIQMLHIGSYDSEPASFDLMNDFMKKEGYRRIELTHKEIYLSDSRRTEKEKLKTVLRIRVEKG